MKTILLAHGAQVQEASDGAEALSKYQADPSGFDIVVLDMVMPVIGGAEAFRRIRDVDPEQVIIIYSGFAQDENVKSLLAMGACRFIRKPFRSDDFIRMVRSLLHAEHDVRAER